MEAEVSQLIGAELHERSETRTTHRNGYREREWDTPVGTLELEIPKLRQGSYFPSLLEPRRRHERALLAVVQEAYVHGVSTRAVDNLRRGVGHQEPLQGPGQPDLQGTRRPGPGLPDSPPRWRLPLPLPGCHL